MANAKMFTYPHSDHALPHWKCVLQCCDECTCINLTDQETNKQHKETTTSIRFHIYHIIARCTAYVRILLKDKKICYICKQESSSDEFRKIYTRKKLVMTETSISDFHTSFYIPAIQKLSFHLPHVHILGKNYCCEIRRTAFKNQELFQDALCCRDYAERLVERFAH